MGERQIEIIGGGWAGCLLAHELIRRGWRVQIRDGGGPRATDASPGIVNPVIGPRLSVDPEARFFLQALRETSDELTTDLGTPGFTPRRIIRIGPPDWRSWLESKKPVRDRVAPFLKAVAAASDESGETWLTLTGGGTWAIAEVRRGIEAWLRDQGVWRDELLPTGELKAGMADCRGVGAAEDSALPFQPVQGSWLRAPMPVDFGEVRIRRRWCHRDGEGRACIGATHTLVDNPSAVAEPTGEDRERLAETCRDFLGSPPPVATEMLTGIRPSLADARPAVGPHPTIVGAWIFNGLGGRGAFWGPGLAMLLADALEGRSVPRLQRFDPARFAGAKAEKHRDG
jgi:glycine/D-amino acid oxidase-like deaminating enzyme